MDEGIFRIVMIIMLILMTLSIVSMVTRINRAVQANTDCSAVIDVIYEQCSEEGNINITTMHGNNAELLMINDTCVVRT